MRSEKIDPVGRTKEPSVDASSHGRSSADWAAGMLLAIFVCVGRWDVSRVLAIPGADWIGSYFVFYTTFAVCAAGLAVSRMRKHPVAHDRRLPNTIFALLVLGLLASLHGGEGDYARGKAADLLLMLVILWGCYAMARRNPFRVFETFVLSSLALGGVLALLALVAGTTGGGRLSVLGGGPNTYARLMGLLIFASIAALRFGWLSRPPVAALSVLAGALLVRTGSRGGLVAVVIAVATYGLLSARATKSLRATAAGVTIFGLFMAAVAATGDDQASARFIELTLRTRHVSGRDLLYGEGWRCLSENPLIGIGLGDFDTFHTTPLVARYPHNLFLETGCEYGIAGLALAIVLAGSLLFYIVKGARTEEIRILVGIAIMYLLASQFSGDVFDSRGFFAALMLISVLRDTDRAATLTTGQGRIKTMPPSARSVA